MTVREQLAEQAERIRATWALGGPSLAPGWYRRGDITAECRTGELPLAALKRTTGLVNAAEICGVPAGHLLLVSGWPLPDDPDRITVRLMYSERPWQSVLYRGCSYTDFDALLDALESGEGPPEREETWHDRPSQL